MTETETIDLLRRLMAIPSVNPEHTQDPDIAGEGRLAEFLAGWLEGRGARMAWEDGLDGRPNVVGVFGPETAPRTLLLTAHMDTVGVEGMTIPPFEGRLDNGKVYGRGACDCKGPMVTGLSALTPERVDRLSAAGWRLLFAGVFGEETGNLGADRLVRSGWRADRAIVLEPTDLAVVHAHKGALWLEIEALGRPAHGSTPSLGVNAITGLLRVWQHIEQRHRDQLEQRRHPLLGPPTLSLGQVEGGTATNVVPARCIARLDRRILPDEDPAALIAEVETAVCEVQAEGGLVSGAVRVIKNGRPFFTPPGAALVRGLAQACERSGVKPRLTGSGWYSDAGPLSALCPEIVVFGPGGIAQAHTADEFIEVKCLQKACAILGAYLDGLARPGGEETA